MNKVLTFCLVMVLAGPLHAQVCSGGASGGVDATGNQCSDAAAIVQYANGADIASPLLSAKMSGIHPSAAATAATHPAAKMSGAPAATTDSALGGSRFAKAALPPSAPAKTAKVEAAEASPCSGGASGGMDATGNQCAEYVFAGMNAGSLVAAMH